MEIGNIIPHIEALIFASDKPLTAMELTELANNAFGFMDEKLSLEQIQTAIDGIVEKYRSEFYPFEVRESGGGLQFLTKKDYHKTVAQLNGEKFLKRLSTAALETLSIIAYKQPVTKGEIEAIRGVSSDYAIQRLLEKELVVITGRNEKMPGHPLVYATSRTFMDYFGINSPDDLPKLKEIFDETMVNPTAIDGSVTGRQDESGQSGDDNDTGGGDNNELLAVTQNGELTKARIRSDKNDDSQRSPRSAVQDDNPESSPATDPSENVPAEEVTGEDATYTVYVEDVGIESDHDDADFVV
ncbi:MAG: SMC-Scp complex subunit ScpB, partial [Chitinophagaceae bacterium]